MGRGRQKAKHTKVARQLKYSTPTTDLSELERELAAKNALAVEKEAEQAAESDPWEEYAEKYNAIDDSNYPEDNES
ncbi:DUF3073 family protein [Canibacter sp. lx-72]|uniref:DUF3073 domain-containing protein n=1 Tax=Canibacter zhuwentaonis TaxID=2837491 RepID=UPI001BDCA80A|nr:DUF3073 domain-containing protein [Canibacter zhuwentaonis]MBT1018290.1 DUF3073 family protein [Canibacter zhuwentaonis]MBT1035477.1 DUF3073 family protein [Canibacter zhuwentaonis]